MIPPVALARRQRACGHRNTSVRYRIPRRSQRTVGADRTAAAFLAGLAGERSEGGTVSAYLAAPIALHLPIALELEPAALCTGEARRAAPAPDGPAAVFRRERIVAARSSVGGHGGGRKSRKGTGQP